MNLGVLQACTRAWRTQCTCFVSLNSRNIKREMEKPAKRVKKVAKKSLMNTSKPKEQAKKRLPAIPVNVSTDWREEEELVDYESELQPCFSPHVDDISEPGDSPRTPIHGSLF